MPTVHVFARLNLLLFFLPNTHSGTLYEASASLLSSTSLAGIGRRCPHACAHNERRALPLADYITMMGRSPYATKEPIVKQ